MQIVHGRLAPRRVLVQIGVHQTLQRTERHCSGALLVRPPQVEQRRGQRAVVAEEELALARTQHDWGGGRGTRTGHDKDRVRIRKHGRIESRKNISDTRLNTRHRAIFGDNISQNNQTLEKLRLGDKQTNRETEAKTQRLTDTRERTGEQRHGDHGVLGLSCPLADAIKETRARLEPQRAVDRVAEAVRGPRQQHRAAGWRTRGMGRGCRCVW